MLRNYVNIAWRNLARHKAYTLINLLGLGLGIACATIIFAVVRYHLSFDTFHPNANRTYRIVTERHRDDISYQGGVPAPLGKQFRADFAFADHVARKAAFDEQAITIRQGRDVQKYIEKAGVACVDPDFFAIFSFPLLHGDARTALAEPNTVLLTERIARKYFGTTDVLGRTLRWHNDVDLRITGILADPPPNTDHPQEIYTAFGTIKSVKDGFFQWLASDDSWGGIASLMHCYVTLKPGVSAQTVEAALVPFRKKYQPADHNDRRYNTYRLQPFAEVHFDARFDGKVEKKYLLALGLIGLVLIATACLNFINLATAQALGRAKEVGVRKVLGGQRGQLFGQFMTETALLVLAAVGLAYGLAQVALPFINEWFEARISLRLAGNGELVLFLGTLAAVVTLLAGAYPGLVLAGFQPIMALRGRIGQREVGGFSLRRVLVVGQFVIAQVLIIGTLVVTQQMRYAKQTDLGFAKDAVVLLDLPVSDKAKLSTLHNQLAQLPGVAGVSFCSAPPAGTNNFTSGFQFGSRAEPEAYNIHIKYADDQFLNTFKLKLVAGRNIVVSDTVREYLINETAVKKLGLSPGSVLGKRMQANDLPGVVVGVVSDFHNLSFHEAIEPLCIASKLGQYQLCAVKIGLGNLPTTLAALERTWNGVFVEYSYNYEFLDDHIGRFYELEALMLRLILVFAAIAIFIGCLGLYGLVSFVVAQCTKEIGVRKVLGATVAGIVWQLDRQFIALVLMAFAIAAPLAGWAMNSWLAGFTYRVPLGADTFALAALGTLGLTLTVVGYQSVKAALMNPVKSLRSE